MPPQWVKILIFQNENLFSFHGYKQQNGLATINQEYYIPVCSISQFLFTFYPSLQGVLHSRVWSIFIGKILSTVSGRIYTISFP